MVTDRQRVVVLTGGPGAGKTTLLEALRARGHAVVNEAAIDVIDQLVGERGVDGARAWRAANVLAFQRRIAERQAALEAAARAAAEPLIFCDRGLVDGLAYLALRGVDPPPELLRLVDGARYDAVFLLETLAVFDARPDTGRISNRADSLAIGQRLRAVYELRGHRVVDIPERGVGERVELVLRALGLA